MNEEKIKRYHVRFSDMNNIPTAYCLPSDVTALESELTRLREENEEMLGLLEYIRDIPVPYEHRHWIGKVMDFLSSLKGENT